MTLKSKSFSVYKGDTLEQVSTFINQEIGLDAYLIKGIQAVALNENVTQLTLLYNKYPDNILDSIAPREGSVPGHQVAYLSKIECTRPQEGYQEIQGDAA